MDIKILTADEKNKYYDDMLDMLTLSDDDFVPPLSSRSSTTQKDLASGVKSSDGVKKYLGEMMNQQIMASVDGDKLLGFVSFRENYTNNEIKASDLPNIYISTLIVNPESRGMGITRKMYDILFEEYKNVNIFTRTWSTNGAHIKILGKYGFDLICRIENDRGEGIDTVYFAKRASCGVN